MRFIKLFAAAVMIISFMLYQYATAQYINLEGNNPAIQEYVEASEDNWNRPIFYVFYNSQLGCEICADAIEQIYQIYQQNYAQSCSLFEIDYADDPDMKTAYDLSQPLSIVVVRINDGLARGYYKIENPQNWLSDPFLMQQEITTQINEFLN